MKIRLKGKKLLINDKNFLLATSGDNLTSKIEFEMDRVYEGTDLSEYVGSIVVDDGKNMPYTDILTKTVNQDTLTFVWEIKRQNTCSSEINVVLKLVKSEGETDYIWQSYKGIFKVMPTIIPKGNIPKASADLVAKLVYEGVELKENALSLIEQTEDNAHKAALSEETAAAAAASAMSCSESAGLALNEIRERAEEIDEKLPNIPPYMIPMGSGSGGGELISSGIAVDKINKLPSLIASGTTTEDASVITVSNTSGGNVVDEMGNQVVRSFSLCRFICVKLTIPTATKKTRVWVKLNNVNVGYVINATSTTAAKTYTRFDIYYTGGGNWCYSGWSTENAQATGNPWTVPWYENQGELVSSIAFTLSDSVIFPAGTKYEIYGIEV